MESAPSRMDISAEHLHPSLSISVYRTYPIPIIQLNDLPVTDTTLTSGTLLEYGRSAGELSQIDGRP